METIFIGYLKGLHLNIFLLLIEKEVVILCNLSREGVIKYFCPIIIIRQKNLHGKTPYMRLPKFFFFLLRTQNYNFSLNYEKKIFCKYRKKKNKNLQKNESFVMNSLGVKSFWGLLFATSLLLNVTLFLSYFVFHIYPF